MMGAALAAASLFALPPAAASGLVDLQPVAVAGKIDVTSFPNSIEPRREEGLRTFGDYGFSEIDWVDPTVELYEPDRSWMFGITVLGASPDRLLLCVLDMALGGPTYHTQDALEFRAGDDGLLIATGATIVDPACPHMGE